LLGGCLSLDDYPRVHPLEPENASLDFDGDGVANGEDNCPRHKNPTQADANGDRVGDACDPWAALPRGTFQMGSNDGDFDERPVHPVTVPAFEILKTEVTVAMYRACQTAGSCSTPDTGGSCTWSSSAGAQEDHPINCVDWDQARAFAAWVGGGARLCTEAEWEYAARSGGQDRTYPWGDATPTCDRAVMTGCAGDTQPVCSRMTGNSDQGVCDLAGNVWEWVQDWFHSIYEGAPTDGSAWENPAGSVRVLRGGSWGNAADSLRASYRGWLDPGLRYGLLGFRLCR
jgi:formylglycine-generating enzyme required for sulfatase activity